MSEDVTNTQQKRIGEGRPGPGRPKGLPNKSTAAAREAIARFVDGNVDRLQGWLDEIAADPKHGPMAAFKCVQEVMEYHIPKLARTEHTGKDGGAIIVQAASGDEAL
jgi:hypothetical protein